MTHLRQERPGTLRLSLAEKFLLGVKHIVNSSVIVSSGMLMSRPWTFSRRGIENVVSSEETEWDKDGDELCGPVQKPMSSIVQKTTDITNNRI